jgi:Tol biopolymer transport system component
MVHVYRAAVYLIMIGAALLFYLLLRRLFGKRTRVFPVVAALLVATGLTCCTYYVLSKPVLLRKYAPFLKVKKGKSKISMVYMQSEVRICNLDGSADGLFLSRDFITTRDIVWSQDGTRIICSRVKDSNTGMNLYVYDANGENPVQLTSGRGIARRPSWSPDGTRIVFDYRPGLRQLATDICVINADGSGRQRLLAGDQVHAYHPVWAPDGNSIYCCVRENRRDDIWVMDIDGGNLRQLTFTPDKSETEPAVSPDGETIVLSVNRREIYLVDTDGGHLRPLADEAGKTFRGRDPSWSPDGQRILYAGFGAKNSRRFIKEVGVDGIGLRQIPVEDGKLLTPVQTPDGSRLAYLRFVKTVVRTVSPLKNPAGGPGLPGGDED